MVPNDSDDESVPSVTDSGVVTASYCSPSPTPSEACPLPVYRRLNAMIWEEGVEHVPYNDRHPRPATSESLIEDWWTKNGLTKDFAAKSAI